MLVSSSQTSTEDNMNYAAIIDGINSVSRFGTSACFSSFSSLASSFSVLPFLKLSRLPSRKERRGFTLRPARSPAELHGEILHLQRLSDHAALQRDCGVDRLQEHGGHLRRTGDDVVSAS